MIRRLLDRLFPAPFTRDDARRNGHQWWPCSKRSLYDYPTECDQREARRPA